MKTDITYAGAKAAPPVAVAAMTMNDVLIYVSIGYVVLQTAYLLWKWYREYRASKKAGAE